MVSKSAQKNNSAQKSMDSAQKLLDSAQKLIDSAAVLKPRNSAQNSAGTIGTGLVRARTIGTMAAERHKNLDHDVFDFFLKYVCL